MIELLLGAIWRGFMRLLADDFLVAYTLLLIALMGIGGTYAKYQFSVGA